MSEDHKVIIEPTVRDARELRQWLMSQGDMRGFICSENGREFLVVFHSYGHTHSTMVSLLGLNTRGAKKTWVEDTLIFRTDGTVLSDCIGNGIIDDPVIRAIYHPVIPRWAKD